MNGFISINENNTLHSTFYLCGRSTLKSLCRISFLCKKIFQSKKRYCWHYYEFHDKSILMYIWLEILPRRRGIVIINSINQILMLKMYSDRFVKNLLIIYWILISWYKLAVSEHFSNNWINRGDNNFHSSPIVPNIPGI